MASLFKIKGTIFPSFFIGKRGPEIFQGTTIPLPTEGKDGDLYIQTGTGTEQLYQKRNGIWIPLGSTFTNIANVTSSPYTITFGDDVALVNLLVPGPATIFLPNNPPIGSDYIVKDGAGIASTNTITIGVAGGGTIDGLTTAILDINYEAYRFLWNGTEYNIV